MEEISLTVGKVYETEDGEQILISARDLTGHYLGFRFIKVGEYPEVYISFYQHDGNRADIHEDNKIKKIVREIKE